MIPYGAFLWHLAVSALLLVVWRLSARLGRAMRDDVGPIVLFPCAAVLAASGGALCLVPVSAGLPGWIGPACDLAAGALGWYAARHSWGWLWDELRQKPSTGRH